MKYYGRKVRIHQFANDWITIDEVGGAKKGQVINPTALRDVKPVDIAAMRRDKNVGNFWKLFEYDKESERFNERGYHEAQS